MKKILKDTSYSVDLSSLESNWWAFAVRGALSILFGGVAIWMPETTVLTIAIMFGVYSIGNGVFSLMSGLNRLAKGKRWGTLVLNGLIGIGAGLLALIMPHIASISLAVFLWTIISIWSIVTGLIEINAAVRLRQEIENEWLLALNGLISIVLGVLVQVLLWINPLMSLTALGLVTGANFVASGITLLSLAFKLHNREKELPSYKKAEQLD
jgi:uncharacterized membrane protein HdeD (DUF308 family)